LNQLDLLDALSTQPLQALTLGVRQHAILAGRAGNAVDAVFKAHGHKCHVCSVELPGGMEIDHLDGNHSNLDAANMRPICQPCHYAHHPVWAAQHKRFRLIWMPSLSQVAINRTFWAVTLLADARDMVEGGEPAGFLGLVKSNEELVSELAARMPGIGDEDLLEGISLAVASVVNGVLDDVETREMHCARILGSANPEAFVEGFFQVRDLQPEDVFSPMQNWLREGLRYWPEVGAKSWRLGTLVDVSEDLVAGVFSPSGPLGEKSIRDLLNGTAKSPSPAEARVVVPAG